MSLNRTILATSALVLSATAAMADFQMTVLHTNDFHSRFEPISKYDSGCSAKKNTAGKCFGGSARLATAIAAARKRHKNSILVSGGDQFQGSLFYSYYKGKFAAEMMNKLGYDGMTVGNHEFDDGPAVLRGFMDAINFPILMSNADVSGEPLLAGKLAKSTIIERGGQKIGLIGLTPHDTSELASPGKNIIFTDPVGAVQHEVDKLTAKGVNKIVVLSHSGYGVDQKVAAKTKGVDVIVGGHTNTYLTNKPGKGEGPYPTMVGTTAIVSAYAYGKLLGELNLTFDDAGVIKTAVGEPIVMSGKIIEDATVKKRVATMAIPLDVIRKKIVARSTSVIEGDSKVCRVKECAMGNLVADALLDRVKSQGVTMAIINSGGMRTSIDAGEVTMGEVMTVLPFKNTLSTFEISGKDVVAALENAVSNVKDGAGRFPQIAGIRFTWDAKIEANKGRVQQVLVKNGNDWVPIKASTTYLAVTNNYARNGGDGFKVFEDAKNAYDFGPNVADVVAEYMAKSGEYKPYTDGRITQK